MTAGLVQQAFDELARRWTPILDAFDEARVDLFYEIHPGKDLFDGATVETFLDSVGGFVRRETARSLRGCYVVPYVVPTPHCGTRLGILPHHACLGLQREPAAAEQPGFRGGK